MKFTPWKSLVTGVAALVAGHAAAAEKAPEITHEQLNPTPVSTPEIKTDPLNNSEVVTFAAEREATLKKLEEEKTRTEYQLQRLTAELQAFQTDFLNADQEALKFLGKRKSKLAGFENALADLAMKMGEEKVDSKTITSPEAVDGLLGILLSENGPLKEQARVLTETLQGQLGSTVMTASAKPGKYISPDMKLHKQLAQGPRDIVATALKIVEEKHNLEQVTAQLNDLKGDATAQAEIPTVTF